MTSLTNRDSSNSNIYLDGYHLYVNGKAVSGNTDRKSGDTDVLSDWAKEEVSAAINAGLVPEHLRQAYQTTASRADTAQMFVTLIELASGQSIDEFLASKNLETDTKAFTDTSDSAALAANALGLIQGVGNQRFDPDSGLTRAQIAAILNRAATVLGVNTSGCAHRFHDVSNHWVDSELGWAVENGVIEGRGNGVFDPNTAVTIQEAIAITYRALRTLQN